MVTVAEAAKALNVSKRTIARLYRTGELRVVRSVAGGVLRIYSDSLRDWVERNSYGGER